MKSKKQLRDVWIAAAILLFIVILAAANVLASDAMLDDMLTEIEDVDTGDIEKTKDLEDKFSRVAFFLSITINHDDLEDAEDLLAELTAAIKVGDEDQIEITKSRLRTALGQLRRLSAVGIDSIICISAYLRCRPLL